MPINVSQTSYENSRGTRLAALSATSEEELIEVAKILDCYDNQAGTLKFTKIINGAKCVMITEAKRQKALRSRAPLVLGVVTETFEQLCATIFVQDKQPAMFMDMRAEAGSRKSTQPETESGRSGVS